MRQEESGAGEGMKKFAECHVVALSVFRVSGKEEEVQDWCGNREHYLALGFRISPQI